MVALNTVDDYVILVLVAAAGGAIGGLAATLVPTTSPSLNKPRELTGPLVGAVAAMAVLLIFPGTKESTATMSGQLVVTTTWSVLRVVPVALIAGWAGPKVLTVLQERLLAATNEAKLQATLSVATIEAEKLANADQHAELANAKEAINAAATS
jgi:hypothetical protein